MAQGGDDIVDSLRGRWWALPLSDEVGVRYPSRCLMPGRELLLDDDVQLVGYLLEFARKSVGVESSDKENGLEHCESNRCRSNVKR